MENKKELEFQRYLPYTIYKSLLNKDEVTESVQKQFILFLFIGAICFLIDMGLLLLFVEAAGADIITATGMAVIIATYAAYILNKKYIFKSGRHTGSREMLLFFVFSVTGFFLNIILMYTAITYLDLWYVPAKILITLFIALFNFSTRKKIIFAK